MRKFDITDKKILQTYNTLIRISHEQFNHVNELMSKYEVMVLRIVNDKYSKIKKSNSAYKKYSKLNKI